jgi:hypothetical protein
MSQPKLVLVTGATGKSGFQSAKACRSSGSVSLVPGCLCRIVGAQRGPWGKSHM